MIIGAEKLMNLVKFQLDDELFNEMLPQAGHIWTWIVYPEKSAQRCIISIISTEDGFNVKMGTCTVVSVLNYVNEI